MRAKWRVQAFLPRAKTFASRSEHTKRNRRVSGGTWRGGEMGGLCLAI